MRLTDEEQAALKASLHEIIEQLDITHCNIEACGRKVARSLTEIEQQKQRVKDTGVRILWIVGNVTPDPEVGIYPVGSVSADDVDFGQLVDDDEQRYPDWTERNNHG